MMTFELFVQISKHCVLLTEDTARCLFNTILIVRHGGRSAAGILINRKDNETSHTSTKYRSHRKTDFYDIYLAFKYEAGKFPRKKLQ